MQFRDQRLQLGQAARVFLATAATQPDQRRHAVLRLAKRILKRSIVNPRDIPIDPRRRVGLMNLQPLLCLANAVVEKLGRHVTSSKRFNQLPLHHPGELARVNRNFCRGCFVRTPHREVRWFF